MVHEHFLRRALAQPWATALTDGVSRVSYAEAAERSERLAAAIVARVGRGGRIAFSVRKSPETIMLMLGCLRSGVAYVPLDPATPSGRLVSMVQDSDAELLVVDQRSNRWSEWKSTRIATLSELESSATAAPRERAAPDTDDIAYILYTSGSTGEPKGVPITHRNAASFVEWARRYAGLDADDRVAVHAPLHFDLAVFDIYASLAAGATVIPVDERTTIFPQALFRFLQAQRVSVLYAVPSALIALVGRSSLGVEGLPSLRLLLYAGEEFHPAALRRLVAAVPGVAVHNLYGPIETNVVTALCVEDRHLQLPRIPIGRPVDHARVFLLANDGNLVTRAGCEGEIVVAGPSVTPGYLNRPDLTAAARVTVVEGERGWDCHRTGDFARRDRSGMLHFLGRKDGLVKTRGFRVELGDVESALLEHQSVAEAAVVAFPSEAHTTLLYAFVVTRSAGVLDERDVIDWCRQLLPHYMVPQGVSVERELPRTGTGKIARRDLLARLETRR